MHLMRLCVFVMLFTFFTGPSAFAADLWVPLTADGASRGEASELTVVSRDDHSVEMSLSLEGIGFDVTETQQGAFTSVILPDGSQIGKQGSPNIPVIRAIVEMPHGGDVILDVTHDNHRKIRLAEYRLPGAIMPVQPPVPKLPGARENMPFVYNDAVYQRDSYANYPVASIVDEGIMRGRRLLVIEVRPVDYHPVNGELSIYRDITVRLTCEQPDINLTRSQLQRYANPLYDTMFSDILVKDNSSKTFTFPPANAPVGYLVISADSLQGSLSGWVDWKTRTGYQVTVVPRSVAGTTTAAVKSYIQTAYNTWPIPPVFVLFVGDTDTIPTYTSGSADDMPYTDLDGGGYWTPDVLLGRWPARTTDQLNNIIAKSMQFDQMTMTDKSYMKNSVWLASSDHATMLEATHQFCFDNYVLPTDPANNTMFKVYERLGGGTADFASNVNAGRSLVAYSGHGYGNGTGTASVHFVVSNVQALTNANKMTNVSVYACGTNLFDQTASFGEVWLTEPNKGSVSFWGTSDSSYWDEDDALQRRTFKSAFNEQQTCLTAAHFTGLIQVYTSYQGSASYYFRIYNLMGDPSLDFLTRIPQSLTLTSAPSVAPVPQQYPVTVTTGAGPVQNALVAASMNGVLLGAAYSNSSGIATLSIHPPTPGTMLIQVTAHNNLPTTKNVIVQASGCGIILLSAEVYSCNATAGLTVYDSDLNVNPSVAETVNINLSSTSQTMGIPVILTETGPNTGEFTHQVYLPTALTVNHGDILTARYNDANCNGSPQIVTDTATLDCQPPLFSNITVDSTGTTTASISWNTSELSTTWLAYRSYSDGNWITVNTGTLTVDHQVNLTNLQEYTRFNFKVGGSDAYGNFAQDDNNGAYYYFATWTWGELASFTLDQDPGWTMDTGWGFGQPTGSGGTSSGGYGSPDPTSGYTGTNVYGYNLAGNYTNSMSSARYLTSGVIDCSNAANVRLEYYRWLGVESSSYDHATVSVSKDNGQTWTEIWQNGESFSDSQWTLVTHDITAIAAGSSQVRVRWSMGPTDGSIVYCGWNIDDVRLLVSMQPQSVPTLSQAGIALCLLFMTVMITWFSRRRHSVTTK